MVNEGANRDDLFAQINGLGVESDNLLDLDNLIEDSPLLRDEEMDRPVSMDLLRDDSSMQ